MSSRVESWSRLRQWVRKVESETRESRYDFQSWSLYHNKTLCQVVQWSFNYSSFLNSEVLRGSFYRRIYELHFCPEEDWSLDHYRVLDRHVFKGPSFKLWSTHKIHNSFIRRVPGYLKIFCVNPRLSSSVPSEKDYLGHERIQYFLTYLDLIIKNLMTIRIKYKLGTRKFTITQ